MNWVNALCDLYDKNDAIAGKFIAWGKDGLKPLILLPLSHTTVLAQIEVALDGHGNFIRARSLSKEESLTLIPVSDASAIRTSGPVPHPLMDSLQYVAGDYDDFVRTDVDKNSESIAYRKRYDEYIINLEHWCSSVYSHLKAISVLEYLKKARLINDLVHENILLTTEDGILLPSIKINGINQEKSFIRFRVETGEVPDLSDETGRYSADIWKDTTLHRSYCEYLRSQQTNSDLCYLTGTIGSVTESHPKKIRNEGDGTKLLSSNDSSGYTFRGRFHNSSEAFSIGYEASQKAHNALKWIVRRQGYLRDGLCVVTWESNLNPYISVFDDAADVVIGAQDVFSDDIFTDTPTIDQDTNYLTAVHFNHALKGYKQNIENTSNMVVMALDAATPGRLAITYYNSLPSSHYLDNIDFWHESCRWRHSKFVDKRLIFFEGMASLGDIALALYGTEQNKFLKHKTDNTGKAPMLVSTFQRLVPCMLERKRIPKDFERLAVSRASTPLAYETYNWQKILAVACSLVKKTKYDWKGENWSMALQNDCDNRSYLYGRLLAIADLVEDATFESDERRETNAIRYMNAFSRRPFRTWKIIEEKLTPYFNKLTPGLQIYFKKYLNEIQSLFTPEVFSDDSPLDGLYLLGYHNQTSEHYTKNKDLKESEKKESSEGGNN